MFHLFNRYDIAATELQFAGVDSFADQCGWNALRGGSGHDSVAILYSQDIAPLILTKGPTMGVARCRAGDAGTGASGNTHFGQCHCQPAIADVMGGNDMLRGLDPAATRANLDAMISRLRARDVAVLLAGMLAPRNLGAEYVTEFDSLYPALAAQHGIGFYPFFLDGVAMDAALNLPDGLHPNKAGIDEITRRILPVVVDMLARLQG